MSLDSTQRFNQRAGFYSRYRPGYPDKILGILEEEIGFDDEAVIADIGSGTGLLTKLFLGNGNRVFGVEPNDEMRSYAERDLSGFEKFVSVKGTAERTKLRKRSVDLITVGQALHWFKPAKTVKEFSRISKPSGNLLVVYNEWKGDGRFMRAYRAVIRRNERDRAKATETAADARHMARFFKDGKCSKFSLPNEQVVDFQGLRGRLLSASYMPTPYEGKSFAKFEEDVRKLFDTHNADGRVRLLYVTKLFVGRVRVLRD